MVDRIKAAVDARPDEQFVIMARTDALANEGLDAVIRRAQAYVAAGADMIFAEAATVTGSCIRRFARRWECPFWPISRSLARRRCSHAKSWRPANVDIILYCCAAYRAMNAAALKVYKTIRAEGTQRNVIPLMQTRAELYEYLNYDAYEKKLDELFAKRKDVATRHLRRPSDSLMLSGGCSMSYQGETSCAPVGFKPKKSVALSGTVAGNTALCTVGHSGNDLHYRGYDIKDLTAHCAFEEVAHLLVHGKLPNAAELAAYKARLRQLRGLPDEVKRALELLPCDGASDGRAAHGCVGAGLRAA